MVVSTVVFSADTHTVPSYYYDIRCLSTSCTTGRWHRSRCLHACTFVYRWLSDNLLPYEGCTIGFDVEVSMTDLRVRAAGLFGVESAENVSNCNVRAMRIAD